MPEGVAPNEVEGSHTALCKMSTFLLASRGIEPAVDNLLPEYGPTATSRNQSARWCPRAATTKRDIHRKKTLAQRPLKIPSIWPNRTSKQNNKVLLPFHPSRRSASRAAADLVLDPKPRRPSSVEPSITLHKSFVSLKLGTITQLAQIPVMNTKKKIAVNVPLCMTNFQGVDLDCFLVSCKSSLSKCSTLKPGEESSAVLGRCEIWRPSDAPPVSARLRQRRGLWLKVLPPQATPTQMQSPPECSGPTTLKFSNLREHIRCVLSRVRQDGLCGVGHIIEPGCHVIVDASLKLPWRMHDCATGTVVEVSFGMWAVALLQTFQIAWTPASSAESRLSISSKNAELKESRRRILEPERDRNTPSKSFLTHLGPLSSHTVTHPGHKSEQRRCCTPKATIVCMPNV